MEAQQKLAKLKYTPNAKVQKQRQADMLQCEIQTLGDRRQRVSAPAKFNYERDFQLCKTCPDDAVPCEDWPTQTTRE